MSLYNDASLAMIPSAIKDGKLYSIRPTDGSGDFTFSRGTTATRVNASGLIEKGRENLFLQSNTFDTTWTTTNASVTEGQSGYDGSSDAWLLTATSTLNCRINQSISGSGVQTFSVYAKANTADFLALKPIVSGTTAIAYFDLSNGLVGTTNSAVIDTEIISIGSSWYRCSISFNDTNTKMGIFVVDADNSTAVTSGNSIYIQDSQLEQGLVATDYIETTTTSVQVGITDDLPRLDYSGGASCPSLLLEPQRTNNVLFSEYRQGSDAVDFRITTTSNAAISPEGVQNATLFTENTDTNTHFHSIGSVSWVSGTTYTISAYVKSNGRDLHLGVGNPAVIQFTTTYDLTNGVVLSSAASASSIEDAGNGWWRITATATAALSSGTNILPFLYNNATNYTGDGTSGIYVYGFQAEVGSYPTSYIPTYGASVTRNADSCVKTSATSLIGQTQGTLYAEFYGYENTGSEGNRIIAVGGGGTSERIVILDSNTNIRFLMTTGGSTQVSYVSSVSAEGSHKVAIAYANNDVSMYIDGVQVSTDTSATIPACSNIYIGTREDGGTTPIAGGVKQALVFKTRLTNSELADLTTL